MIQDYEILLVEDNLAQAVIFEEALRLGEDNVGLRVSCDPEDALRSLRDPQSRMPDLIFLDLHLPKKSGLDVLKEIKEDAQLRKIPVAILTSSNRQEDILEAYARQANCYLQKPLDFEEFVAMIRSVEKFWLKGTATGFSLAEIA